MTDRLDQESALAPDAGEAAKRVLVITRRGPPERPFGWEILDNNGEVARLLETFAARDEASADGQRTLESDLNF